MNRYFPRNTIELRTIESPGFKRLTLSLLEMAVITGVVIRLLRAVTLTHADSSGWVYIAGAIMLGGVVFFGMIALHMANYTLRQWLWRAPAFALCEATAEMIVSAILMVLGREPVGTGQATLALWWPMAGQTLLNRTLAACLFGAALAGVIHVVRRVVITRERDARAAASLRDELFSEAPEAEIDRSQAS